MTSIKLNRTEQSVVWVTINRPDAMNAMNQDVMRDLTAAFCEISSDPSVRAVVLTGAGERAFCAGGDIKAGADGHKSPYQMSPGETHPLVRLFKAVNDINVPIIARVNGHALGGGFGLVCMADMAIGSRNAKLGSPEVKIGIFPMVILAHMLRLVPLRSLYEMAITGRVWSADDAFSNGIFNSVVDTTKELDAAVDNLLTQILANSQTAVRVGIKALKSMEYMDFEERLSYAQLVIDSLSKTEDAKEGMAAFTEKRKPIWPGN